MNHPTPRHLTRQDHACYNQATAKISVEIVSNQVVISLNTVVANARIPGATTSAATMTVMAMPITSLRPKPDRLRHFLCVGSLAVRLRAARLIRAWIVFYVR